jgi:hypothetical protein
MKKLLTLFLILLFVNGYSGGFKGNASPTDPAYVSYLLNRAGSPNIPTGAAGPGLNYVYTQLRANQQANYFDFLYIFAQDNTHNALLSLFGTYSATAVNSPAFSSFNGYVGNGTSSYVSLGFASNNGSNISLNNACYGIMVLTNVVESAIDFGSYDAGSTNVIYIAPYTSGSTYCKIHTSAVAFGDVVTTSAGLTTVLRTVNTSQSTYINGSLIASHTDVSSALSSRILYVCGVNGNGTFSNGGTKRMAMVFGSSGSINQAIVSSILNQYLKFQGTNVY